MKSCSGRQKESLGNVKETSEAPLNKSNVFM